MRKCLAIFLLILVLLTAFTLLIANHRFTVTYLYTGAVPADAPLLPDIQRYKAGTQIALADEPILENYVFSGWTTSDAAVSGGLFKMPLRNVVIQGHFIAVDPAPECFTVTYLYTGTVPSGAPALPVTQSYFAGTEVPLAAIPVLLEHEFIGWQSDDAILGSGKFTMPAQDVVLTGFFLRDCTPETGDNAPLALLGIVLAASLGVCAYILVGAIKKRRDK